MPRGFRNGFQRVEVGYDDIPVTSTQPEPVFEDGIPVFNQQTSLDKVQPGANVPLTETDPNAEYLRRLAGKGYGNPSENTDNSPYLDRLKSLGYGSESHSELEKSSEFKNMFDDLMYEMTKQVFVYPEDLGSNSELLNWIQIEMYETGGYGLNTQQTDSKNEIFGIPLPQNIGKYSAEEIRNAINSPTGIVATNAVGFATIGGGLTQVVTSGAAVKLGKGVWNNFNYEPQSGTKEFGFIQQELGFNTAQKKVNKTICLYMPTSLKTSYGAEYNEEDFSGYAHLADKVKQSASTVSNMIKGLPQSETQAALLKGVVQVTARQALKVASEKLSSGVLEPLLGGEQLKLDKVYDAYSRETINPFIINMFKAAKRRSFDFTFRFLPRSKQELLTVYNIITTLKKYSLPRRSNGSGGRLLEYPAEFKIQFFHNGAENLFLPKIARCALKDVSLSYGDEPFTTFAPIGKLGAAPTKIDMSLAFEELEILTQNRIDEGY